MNHSEFEARIIPVHLDDYVAIRAFDAVSKLLLSLKGLEILPLRLPHLIE